jgi:diaminopimelate decarboxylase
MTARCLVSAALAAVFAAVALAVAGCGQKGPLVLPDKPPASQGGTAPNRAPGQPNPPTSPSASPSTNPPANQNPNPAPNRSPGTEATRPSGADPSD